MTQSLKIVIPMAGLGARMRPHTWNRPKQLIPVAGKPFIKHILAQFNSLPATRPREFVLITSSYEDQVRDFMDKTVHDTPIHYVGQQEMLGQSHAIYQARKYLEGPMLMVFPDTLIDASLGFLTESFTDAVVWVREVPDPRSFGVVQTAANGSVTRIIEKPATREHRLAVVGYYFFPDGAELIDAVEEQLVNDLQIGGEYYLADAVNLLLDRGLRMQTRPVQTWLDAGKPETTLQANAVLLENGHANFNEPTEIDGTHILPPVFIDSTARIEGSVVGPHVSIGGGCIIRDSVIENSIIDSETMISGSRVKDSIIGRRVRVSGAKGIINLGDDSSFISD